MKVIAIIFLIAIIMALSITLMVKNISYEEEQEKSLGLPSDELSMNNGNHVIVPSKRASRFLAQNDNANPRAADHCKKDNDACSLEGGYNSTCCNNKCFDLWDDHKNCGKCKNKCKHMEACCHGECVYLSYDKRHCGKCSNKCDDGLLCIYGMCDYP